MPHRERHRWVKEISKINNKINASTPAAAAEVEEKAAWKGPNFRTTDGGGFQWVNPDLI